MARHRATSSSVVLRIRSTASAATRCLGDTSSASGLGRRHSGKTSVARDSVSFRAVYTAWITGELALSESKS